MWNTAGVSVRWGLSTASRPPPVGKWVRRYREEGVTGLLDRSCRPHRRPRSIAPATARRIVELRRQHRTTRHIADLCGVSSATVARVVRRAGLSRLKTLDPPPPVRRYQRDTPGELIHLDIKKLGRFRTPGHRVTNNRRVKSRKAGWEYLHVCIDDASRVAFAEVFPDERTSSVLTFLNHVLEAYDRMGVTVQQVMTDNGPAYCSHAFKRACGRLGLRHIRTRPYRPQTNGKGRTLHPDGPEGMGLRARLPRRGKTVQPGFQPGCTTTTGIGQHSALRGLPPISSIDLSENNLLTLHI